MSTTSLKLGTRKSLLAWAQSGWVARELERLNPGVSVELVGIETRGDRILDVSLQSVAGKEFFVAELDEALAAGRVDLNVHSMKDLSLDRPAGFFCGAIPARENPRDVVLFGPGIREKLRAGRVLRIGTSSPRRLENIPPFLRRALPRLGDGEPQVDLVEIRGNVNTRLSRVHEPEGSPKQLDAVVLAFAGIIRLWNDGAGREELTRLLRGVRWMVLPLRECPAAPAQGALAVECRRDDSRTREILSKLHHPASAAQVGRERQLLAEWGGGCHQRFGATAVGHPALGELFYIRGVKPDGAFVEDFQWAEPAPSGAQGPAWDGSQWRPTAAPAGATLPRLSERAVFAAHSRAVPQDWASRLETSRVWTSGTGSWERLARLGVWVEGCAENLGFASVAPTLAEPVLGLPAEESWLVLTHDSAGDGWGRQEVVETYRLEGDYPPEAVEKLKSAGDVFWSSPWQFDRLRQFVSPKARQACGPGKTAGHLSAAGVAARIFPGPEEWKRWLKK